MKLLINMLKNRRLLVSIGFILLILLILVAGGKFGLSSNARLISVVVVLFLWVLLLMYNQLQANRSAEILEQSIRAQADEQIMGLRPAKRAEIEQLQQQLTASIDALKKSKLGKGRSGKSALYALPWYMFIGPPASGKTTAIVNSGLEFPFGSDRIQGVGGTRNCDWFFSDSAILLDTAGRYTTEEEDKEEWLSFLEILKKNRRRQPINGVIVGVSIADLANAGVEQLEWHATNIRRRIDELIQRLGVRFPIYLVFTKCDLLQGFVEFFEDFNRMEQEQIWGCTFTKEQQNDPNLRNVFDAEFQKLFKTLIDVRFSRLSLSMKRENRRKVFIFPLEFRSMQENLTHFVGKLFQPNPYQESPNFRGFYFTSGTQEGVPIDRVIDAIARQFELPPEVVGPHDPEMQKKSYFIKKLFTDTIIPDQYLVSETSRTATQKRFLSIAMIVGAVIALGLFILGVSQGYIRSKIDLKRVSDSAQLIRQVNWQQGDALTHFENMEKMRHRVDRLENYAPTFLRWGMYRGNRVLEPARNLYYKKANEFIDTYLYKEITRRLKDYGQYSREKTYNHLKAYLLMGSELERLSADETNKIFLIRELNSILNERFFPYFSDEEEVKKLRPTVEKQIEYFIRLLEKEHAPAYENDSRLVQRVRNAIYERPSIAGVYRRIKREAQNQLLKPFTINEAVGGRYQTIFKSDYQIDEFSTKSGWENYVERSIEAESINPGKEDWVLGTGKVQLPQNMQDPERMANELQRIYFREYAENWWQFLRSIEYEPFTNISSAADRLKSFGDHINSPLMLLINNVTQQTQFESGMLNKVKDGAEGVWDKAKEKVGLSRSRTTQTYSGPSHPVDRHFTSVHNLNNSKDLFTAILGQYPTIGDVLQSMVSEPGIKAKEYADKILQQGSGELVEALRTVRNSLYSFDQTAKKNLFEQPIHQAWATILGEAQQYLNKQWQEMVYRPYRETLASNYPLNQNGRDAPIIDMEHFFQPQGGTFWSFFDQELKPFIRKDSWRAYQWEGQGIKLSSVTIAAFRKANEIAKSLFQRGMLEINFSLKPELPGKRTLRGAAPDVEQICMRIDGSENCYRMGRAYWNDYNWPGSEGPPGASLKVSNRGVSPEPKQLDGVWGWFRLLQIAQIQRLTSSEYQVQWTFTQQDQYTLWIKYRLRASSAYNPFANPRSLFNFNCRRTLN